MVPRRLVFKKCLFIFYLLVLFWMKNLLKLICYLDRGLFLMAWLHVQYLHHLTIALVVTLSIIIDATTIVKCVHLIHKSGWFEYPLGPDVLVSCDTRKRHVKAQIVYNHTCIGDDARGGRQWS